MFETVAAFREVPILGRWRHKAYYGGRGSAKSHGMASGAAIVGSLFPKKIVCGRQFQNSIAESVKSIIEEKIEKFGVSSLFKVTEREIWNRFTDSRFIFIGLDRNPQSVKSLEGADIFWGEEASTFKAQSLEMLEPTIRKPGSEMWWTWNPEKKTDPVDDMFRGGSPPEKSLIKRVSWRDNPFFAQTEMPEQMNRLKGRDLARYLHIWEGEYRQNTRAQIFQNWSIGTRDVAPTAQPMFGADWGFSTTPNVFVECYLLDGGRTLYIAAEQGGLDTPLAAIPAQLDRLRNIRKHVIRADSARPETIDFVRRHGFRITGATKGAGSIKDGIEWIADKDVVIHPACKMTIENFENYSWETDRLGKVKDNADPVDAHNDAIDAIRYATEPARGVGALKLSVIKR